MKILLVGNTNNTHYRLGKILLKYTDIDVTLAIFKNSFGVSKPASDGLSNEDTSWIIEIEKNKSRFELVNKQLVKLCQQFDLIQVSGTEMYSVKCSGKPYIAFPTGGDLFSLALYPWQRISRLSLKIKSSILAPIKLATLRTFLQRNAIKSANQIIETYYASHFRHAFETLNIQKKISKIPFVPPLVVQLRSQPFCGSNNEISILHPTRQSWIHGMEHSADDKGNDKLIRAVATLTDEPIPVRLYMVDYEFNNHDIVHTKKLIADLEIEDRVTWIPTMNQRELLEWYGKVDIVADQFSCGTFGLIGTEALAVGTPLLVYLEEKNKDFFGKNPPALNAQKSEEIVHIIKKIYSGEIDLNIVSEKSKEWFREYLNSQLLASKYKAVYESILNAK